MWHKVYGRFATTDSFRQRGDFRCVPMRQRFVCVEVTVALRVVRTCLRSLARTRAPRDATDEHFGVCQARLDERYGCQRRCRCEAARVTNVRNVNVTDMLRQCADELVQ